MLIPVSIEYYDTDALGRGIGDYTIVSELDIVYNLNLFPNSEQRQGYWQVNFTPIGADIGSHGLRKIYMEVTVTDINA